MALNVNKIEVVGEVMHVRWIDTETGKFHRIAYSEDQKSEAVAHGGQIAQIAQALWPSE